MNWYDYPKLTGAILTPAAPAMPSALAAIALHIAADFTLQTNWMAMEKATGNKTALFIHSAVAGALPVLIPNLLSGDPVKALIAGLAGAVSHYFIDSTNKFGLPLTQGLALDQALHILIAVALVL